MKASRETLKPVLKKAREVNSREHPDARVWALYDPETEELVSGPDVTIGSVQYYGANDESKTKICGLCGPFTGYDDFWAVSNEGDQA